MAIAGSTEQIEAGILEFRRAAVEEFELAAGEAPYDLTFSARVGALDGRHPDIEAAALRRIAAAMTPTGLLCVDGGAPIAPRSRLGDR